MLAHEHHPRRHHESDSLKARLIFLLRLTSIQCTCAAWNIIQLDMFASNVPIVNRHHKTGFLVLSAYQSVVHQAGHWSMVASEVQPVTAQLIFRCDSLTRFGIVTQVQVVWKLFFSISLYLPSEAHIPATVMPHHPTMKPGQRAHRFHRARTMRESSSSFSQASKARRLSGYWTSVPFQRPSCLQDGGQVLLFGMEYYHLNHFYAWEGCRSRTKHCECDEHAAYAVIRSRVSS